MDEGGKADIIQTKIKNIFPNLKDWKDSIGAIFRGSISGFFLGVLPGGGAVIASFVSYAMEKKLSKHPEEFGEGAIEGVAAPESANNAAAGGAYVPLFTLGIPANVAMAMLFGALLIHGLTPGPMLLKDHPEIFWGTVASMYLGNVLLLILNLPFIGLWVKLLQIPYRILFPFILLFCIIGSYSLQNSMFDILIMVIFGVVGYIFRKIGFEAAPMILAFVLGPLLENSLRQSLVISEGSFLIFIQHPISAAVLLIAVLMIFSAMIPFSHIFRLNRKH
jgi:putative tricarboxylic transport membrane protein